MRCAIMQPTYLPWSGYFNLIESVDLFVFLDDVQFEQRSWQSRNRILLNGQPHWITVPVRYHSQQQIIQDIELDDDQPWRRKHSMLLQQIYSKHPSGKLLNTVIDFIQDSSINKLSDLNIKIIESIANQIGLSTKFLRASDLKQEGKRSQHLYNICQACGCDEYLSPVGSMEYLQEERVFENSDVKLEFQNYQPGVYSQYKNPDFVTHLSVLDVIANLGFLETTHYVKQGRTFS